MPSDAYQYQAEKLNEIKKTLQGVLDGFQKQPEQIVELLAFKSQFYNYSMNNAVLIQVQNPNTTFVASYQDWNKKGYHVLRGQHGLKILFPIRTELIQVGEKNGKKQYRRVSDATPEEKKLIESGQLKPVTFTRFGIGTVFDISQTDCPPEKYPDFFNMGYSSDQHAALYQAVKEYAENKGFPVHETDLHSISLRGNFTPATGEIRISDKLVDTEKLSTLTHELGHALMHGDKKAFQLPGAVRELEADCISIMLQHYVGLELTDTRKRHFVQNYDACRDIKDFKIEDILKDVNLTYYNLHKELEPIFDRIVPERTPEEKVETQKVREPSVPTGKELPQETNTEADKKIPLETQGQKASDKVDPMYSHFYYENKYLFTVTGDKEAQEILYRLENQTNSLGYFWSDSGEVHSSVQKEAPVSDLRDADKTKIAYVPFTEKVYQQHIKHLEEIFAPQQEPKPQNTKPPRDYKEQDAAELDQIKYGVSIITLASDMGLTPKQIGGYYTLKEHDSVRIYPETNSFTQFSSGIGGSTIDFVMNFGGYNNQEAIRYLKERYAGNMVDHPSPQPVEKKQIKAPIKKEFKLPEREEGKYSRVYAYLTKTRCLDPEIVQQCFKDGLIYEDIKHNAVFVGKDTEGNAAYATRRSTLTKSNFKCDVAGGRQDIGFFVGSPNAEKLYICEAPIDALSIMSLLKKQGKPLDHASYLATGGTGKDAALYTRLRENPQIREVVLANDRDTAGWKANKKILERLSKDFPHVKIAKLNQKQGKDINEYLQNNVKPPKTRARGMEVER